MPWHEQATKDVISCDKPRGAANKHRSADVRMGKPGSEQSESSGTESIGAEKQTWGTETSQYPEEKRTIE